MHYWTRVCAALVAFHYAEAAIRVLAFPKPSHVPAVRPEFEPDRRDAELPDMMACLRAMSYTCLQRKTAVYLDALNRMDRIRLLGDFVTAVRTEPVDARTPAISERLLDARGHNNVLSLSVLVDNVVRDIVRGHVLRISFPDMADFGPSRGYPADNDK